MTYFGADRRNMTAGAGIGVLCFPAQNDHGMILAQLLPRPFCAVANYYSGRERGTQPGIDKRFCKGNGLRGTDQKGCRSGFAIRRQHRFFDGKRHPRHGRDAYSK